MNLRATPIRIYKTIQVTLKKYLYKNCPLRRKYIPQFTLHEFQLFFYIYLNTPQLKLLKLRFEFAYDKKNLKNRVSRKTPAKLSIINYVFKVPLKTPSMNEPRTVHMFSRRVNEKMNNNLLLINAQETLKVLQQ